MLNNLSEFQERDSGWVFDTIVSLEININKFGSGKGYCSYIKLSDKISKKAYISIINYNEACFARSIISALFPAENHSDRVSSYHNYAHVLNLEDITFLEALNKIRLFKKSKSIYFRKCL